MRRPMSSLTSPRNIVLMLTSMLISSVLFLGLPSKAHGFAEDMDGRVIVGYESDADLVRLVSAVESFGGSVQSISVDLRFLTVRGLGTVENVQSLLSGIASLAYVEEDAKVARVSLIPSDTYYLSNQWAPSVMDAPYAWDLTRGIKDIVVAVIDTGVDHVHEDLAANMWTDKDGHYGYDFVNADTDPMDDQDRLQNAFGLCESNPIYHGTHVAGIVGAVMDNSRGIAGLAQVRIMAVKVLDDCGLGYLTDIALGINYAANNGADVITLSLGGIATNTLRNAARSAWDKGAVLVAASGNDGGGVAYPAAYPTVVAVGSVSRSLDRSTFSSFGSQLELVAPGEDIYATMRTSPYYRSHTGTSQSAPQVAGVAALVLSRNPELTNSEVRNILNTTARDLGDPGWDNEYGHGLVNAYDAVRAALPAGLNASITRVQHAEGYIGSVVDLIATLKAPNGTAVTGKSMDFEVDSSPLGSAVTDLNGQARLAFAIPTTSGWGQHSLRVTFAGDSSYAPSSGGNVLYIKASGGGNISGVVLDASTNERLAFSSVSIPEGNIFLETDSQGEFMVAGLPSGMRMIVASHSGYDQTIVNITVEPEKTSVVPILLKVPGSGTTSVTDLSALAVLIVAVLVGTVFIVALAVFAASRKRIGGLWGQYPPQYIPPVVAEWLIRMHGIDVTRLRPIEMMYVAEGVQMALMDYMTGAVLVVRLDRFGRPVYVYPRTGLQ